MSKDFIDRRLDGGAAPLALSTAAADPKAFLSWADLAQVADALSQAILVTDAAANIVLANGAAARMFQYSREELLHRPLELLLAERCRGLHPALSGAQPSPLQTLGWGGDLVGLTKTGTEFPIRAALNPLLVGGQEFTVCSVEKLGESERASKERSFLAAIVESSEDAIVGTDMDGVIVSWNHAAEELFGYTAEEVLGKSIAILFPPDQPMDANNSLQRIRHRERIDRFEAWRVAKGGKLLNVSVILSPVCDDNGNPQGVSAIYRDISDIKRAQAELIQAKQAAEAASRAKSEFLANMSHEIRTPMNVVLGMTGLLLETPLTEEQHDLARSVQRAANSLLSVINDILDFSKIEAGKLDIDTGDFVLEELAAEVGELMAETASRKGLDLNVALDPSLPRVIRGDAGRIRQVLINIVGNALKFTERGEVTLDIRQHGDPQSPSLRFEVRDTGIGIAPEVQQRIFEAFAQADGSTTRRYGGTGLGLAISKRLVELMGGQIGLQSRVGAGSTFWFTLPLVAGAAEAPPLPDLSDLAGRKVLVVDDNETNRRIVRDHLRPLRMVCEEAADVLQAMVRIREAAAHGAPFEIVVLDYGMPGMTGVDLACLIRADPRLASMRLLLMTSYAEKRCRKLAADVGVDVVLDKPVRLTEFRRALLELCGKTPAPAAQKAPAVPASAPQKAPEGPAPARPRARLLLVEDNQDNRTLALRILEKAGYKCDIAVNGAEAVAAVANTRYAAVLMDCQMPVMDGFTATAAIRRAEGSSRHTPIIAMTAHAMQGDRERCLAAGMDDYITKPIQRDRLLALLEQWVDREAQNPASPAPPASAAARSQRGGAIAVTIDRDLQDLIPDYLEGRRNDVLAIARALEQGNLETVRIIGHGLSGSGAGYGLPRITEIGRGLEQAAKQSDHSQIERLARELDDYVQCLEVSYR